MEGKEKYGQPNMADTLERTGNFCINMPLVYNVVSVSTGIGYKLVPEQYLPLWVNNSCEYLQKNQFAPLVIYWSYLFVIVNNFGKS